MTTGVTYIHVYYNTWLTTERINRGTLLKKPKSVITPHEKCHFKSLKKKNRCLLPVVLTYIQLYTYCTWHSGRATLGYFVRSIRKPVSMFHVNFVISALKKKRRKKSPLPVVIACIQRYYYSTWLTPGTFCEIHIRIQISPLNITVWQPHSLPALSDNTVQLWQCQFRLFRGERSSTGSCNQKPYSL